ncbi:hypothetical protein EV384_6808 [Micromonospora kangleipakensis]|uniref:Uncharacterized protein n=1 Tax=Micromonospora kangleipakensis TaxID=1077942 RepID=A0A4Q8BJK7_9ACTN|nr:hypothetical protein [Micromonospora kangleipakensis]RZU78058.1 hypothetical protein EV384_6808 [Micromonospora kangleipakensis]
MHGPSWSARRRQRRPPGSNRSQKTRCRILEVRDPKGNVEVLPGDEVELTRPPA